MTGRLIELMEYFAEHPSEYLELCQEQYPMTTTARRRLLCHAALAQDSRDTNVLHQSDYEPYVWYLTTFQRRG